LHNTRQKARSVWGSSELLLRRFAMRTLAFPSIRQRFTAGRRPWHAGVGTLGDVGSVKSGGRRCQAPAVTSSEEVGMWSRGRSIVAPLAVILALVLSVATCSPSASQAPSSGTVFFNGDAHVTVTGPVSGGFTVPLARGNVLPGGAFISAEYAAIQEGALTYQGPARVGEYRTARTDSDVTSLMITLAIPDMDPPYDSYISVGGECVISVSEASPSGGEASFTCSQVPNLDGTVRVDAEGTFDAQP
jgi:hypothetical protein